MAISAYMPNCAMTPPKSVAGAVSRNGGLITGSSAINRMNGAPTPHWAGRLSEFHQWRSRSPTPTGAAPSWWRSGSGRHAFALPSDSPRMPVGRNISTSTSSTNATTSRHCGPEERLAVVLR